MTPALRTTDEIVLINISKLLDKKQIIPEDFKKYFEPFSYFTIGKNFFSDGISTIHYLKID
jgi:hypothetical protein